MPYYENVFIARQDISGQQVDGLIESFGEIINQGGGKVAKHEYWGLKNLSYRIKKNRKGHYVLMNVDAPADAVLEMERNMRLSEDIIRYMTVRVDALEEGPSAMMQSRSSRDGRDRRGDRGPRDRRDDRRDGPREPRPAPAPATAAAEAKPKEAD